ncbi:DUF4179 domain-containing protein [Neobacillus novalis]|uniref:DUF4179 domain-containing protein n=1 Tax=Neobacillus novalis TaxID=220687 RepID=A0AA95MPU8_9BACI|nr:DUF4179 domain-containing protein [Neobacillus novalis]WHY87242.1 DUF4179 domain-containing protein [Neobacillus novalis]
MKKKFFQEEYEKIEVPKEAVLQAIKAGVGRANPGEKPRKNKAIVLTAAAAAVILISTSFMVPSVSKVMADMPLIGQFFKDKVGENLASQKLITQLNETSSHNGIDVSITSAYYDGAVIGVTFDVRGKVKTDQEGNLRGIYEIFDGDKRIDDSKELVYLEHSDNGYTGQIQLIYPKLELPADTTFPLEFKSIGEEEGSWRFNVPIKQLAYETIMTDKESEKGDIKVHFDSIIAGKASTAINYTASFPSEGKYDQVRLAVFDDKENPIHLIADGIDLETKKTGNQFIVKGRTIIPQALKGKTSYLEIRPAVALEEPDQFVSINELTPVQIKSNRQDLTVNVEKVSLNGKRFTIDFQINNGENRNEPFNFFQDFAKNDVTLVEESRKDIYEAPINHTIKTLDKAKLRFRSTFDLSELNNFNPEDYVVRVRLGSMSANMPLEIEPVKIELQN